MASKDVDLSQVTIEVGAESAAAVKDIDALSAALSRLNANSKLTRVINNLEKFTVTVRSFQGLNSAANTMTKLSVAVGRLGSIQKLTGLNSAINTLSRFPAAVQAVNPAQISALAASLRPLSSALAEIGGIEKATGLNSTINALRKIPVMSRELKNIDLKDFADNMNRVAVAMKPLANEMDKVARGFSSLPANIQRAIAANQRLTSSNIQAGRSFRSLGAGLGGLHLGFAGLLILLRQVSHYLGGALTEFNAFVENVNLFSVSMGEFTPQAAEFTQSLQDILGVDASEAMRNMGIMQNLTTSFGVAADQAYVLSKNMTQLGYDMSSFFNIGIEDSFTKLQAAISGELEPIRRLGVDISEARLEQELLNLGINASVKELSQADKALLRYIAIMEQTPNAQTDMARTLNSPANMMRVFRAQIDLLTRSIGSLLIPVLNAVLPPMIAATRILREFITTIAAFLGVEVEFNNEGRKTQDNLSNMAGGLGDIESSAKDAAKAVSYLIGGFDELNVLPSAKAGAGAGDGMGNLLGGITLPEYDMFEGLAESRVTELVEKLRKPLTIVFGLVGAIGLGFLAWRVSKTLFTGLSFVVRLLKDAWLIMASQPELLGKSGQMILKWLGPLSGSAALVLSIAFAATVIALRFADLYANSELFRKGLENLWGIMEAYTEGLWKGILEGLEPAKQAFLDLGDVILGLFPESWREPITKFFTETLPELIQNIDLDFGDLAMTALGFGLLFVPGGQIAGAAILGFEVISLGIRGLGLVSDEQMESIKKGVTTVFEFVGKFIGGTLSGIVRLFTDSFGGVITFLKGAFTNDFSTMFNGLLRIAMAPINAIASFFDSLFGTDIVGSIKSAINTMIRYTNRFISWLNEKLHFSYEGYSVLGKEVIPAFDIRLGRLSELPYLAKGGVLDSPHLVMAGEYSGAASNPEIVTPQNLMRDTVIEANTEMVVAIVTAIKSLQQTVEDKDTDVYITEGEIGRAATSYAKQQRRRTGKNPLVTA